MAKNHPGQDLPTLVDEGLTDLAGLAAWPVGPGEPVIP
jgi:hypothetical protein